MFTASRDRRQRDREQRRYAANKRVGHDLAYQILFGKEIAAGIGVLLLAAGAAVAWFMVDHTLIAGVVGGMGILILAAYAVWWVRPGDLRSLAWHLAGASGILLVAAGMLIMQQATA